MDVTHSLTHKHSALSAKSPLFVDRFGRVLQIFHLEFDKEAISDGCRSENAWCQYKGGLEFQVVLVDLFYSVFNIGGKYRMCLKT